MKISVNKLSELTGFDRRTVTRRISELVPAGEDEAGIDSAAALRLLYGAAKSETQASEQRKLAAARRRLLEHKLAERRRDLISVDEACRIVSQSVVACRMTLEAIPDRLADQLENQTAHRIHRILFTEIRRALTDLATAMARDGLPPTEASADGGPG